MKDTIICPFCKFEAESFLDGGLDFEVFRKYRVVGAGFRKNRGCFRCSSNDRDRHLYLYLLLLTDIFSDSRKKVLHIGPELSIMNKMREASNIEYYAIDLNGRAGVDKMNICDMNFADNHFDWIICSHILEHIDEDILAMKEMLRVLKSNGQLVVTVPYSSSFKKSLEDRNVIHPEERAEKFGQKDHARIYSEEDIVARLEKVGFSVEQLNLSDFFGERFSKKFGLIREEKLFICSKNNGSK